LAPSSPYTPGGLLTQAGRLAEEDLHVHGRELGFPKNGAQPQRRVEDVRGADVLVEAVSRASAQPATTGGIIRVGSR
jgi:hypothetical protein